MLYNIHQPIGIYRYNIWSIAIISIESLQYIIWLYVQCYKSIRIYNVLLIKRISKHNIWVTTSFKCNREIDARVESNINCKDSVHIILRRLDGRCRFSLRVKNKIMSLNIICHVNIFICNIMSMKAFSDLYYII